MSALHTAFVLPTGAYGEPLPLDWQEPPALPRLPTPPDPRPYLAARPVLTEADALAMGRVRDRQRAGFSADTTRIDDNRQVAWWRRNRERVAAWLFEDVAGALVGYGALLQQDDGRWVSSVAVLPGFEGRGHGKAITTWTVLAVEHAVYARARLDNPPARKLHDDLIWELVTADNDNEYYVTRPKVRVAQVALNLDHCGVLGQ
jgi:GNAT superfamily N-acetyltransferase